MSGAIIKDSQINWTKSPAAAAAAATINKKFIKKHQISSSPGHQPRKLAAVRTSVSWWSESWWSEINDESIEDNVAKLFCDEGVVLSPATAQEDNTGDSNATMGAFDRQDATQAEMAASASASDTCFPQCMRTQRYNNRENSNACSAGVLPGKRRIKNRCSSDCVKWHLRGDWEAPGWGCVNCLQQE